MDTDRDAHGVADQSCVTKVESLKQFVKVVGITGKRVSLRCLARPPGAAQVERDNAMVAAEFLNLTATKNVWLASTRE